MKTLRTLELEPSMHDAAQPNTDEAALAPTPLASSEFAVGGKPGWWQRVLDFSRANRVWLLCFVGLVTIWTVELYCLQQWTLISPQPVGPRFQFWAPKIRFVLDVLFVGSMCWLLGRRVLAVVAIGAFAANLGLLTYQQYFLHPLSILTILDSWREGTEVSQSVDMFAKVNVMIFFTCLCIKWLLLIPMHRPAMGRGVFWGVAIALVSGYVVLSAIADYCDPLYKIKTTRGVGRLGIIRGYLQPWAAEICYLRLQNDQIRESAERNRNIKSDQLTPIEATIPIRKHLVVIQVESLDNHILDSTINGQEVTPFLNQLKNLAMYYRVRAIHNFASADADFVMLNNAVPSIHVNTYKISGYPFENCLPHYLNQYGRPTVSLHGKSGEFFSRRMAFAKMGFADTRFLEELELKDGLEANSWGVFDDEIFRYSSQNLRQTKGPVCHFIITLTTHTPYGHMRSTEPKEIFPHPTTKAENYMNNMRYFDRSLRDYLASLRDATVVIYADHTADVTIDSFKPDRVGAREYIPVFIYDTETNLAELQKTRGEPIQTDGTLNLLDISGYLRAQIRANGEPKSETVIDFAPNPLPSPSTSTQ